MFENNFLQDAGRRFGGAGFGFGESSSERVGRVDARTSPITARIAFGERRLVVARDYGARDYVGRRGGDLMIDIDPASADIRQILRGQ